ncbi:hypothetical protein F5883DRAFT_518888 [Diaporthe sp. PMI_573]|nr:hypothetical protein F5883DRAFT_518888 [Diaporthaceae sp. PMI_573]
MNTGQHDAVGVVRGLGIVMDGDFAPPKHSADYEAKPLPAVPPRLSIPDMKAVLKTSKRNSGSKQYIYDWDRQGDNISLVTDDRSVTPRSRSLPENDASSIPTTPSNEILSPQPRHSRQKILRLTGNITTNMSLASFEPSQHNSQQKIKQLTGLDVGSSSSSENQTDSLLHPFQNGVSPVSPTSSAYSVDGLEATISEPDSDASDYTLHSDTNGVATQLTAPSFSASPSRPTSTGPGSPTTRVRLSSFALRGSEAASQRGTLADFKAHYRQSRKSSSWGSSRKSSATVVPQPASGSDTGKCSPRASLSAPSLVDVDPPSSPLFKQRSLTWDTSPIGHVMAGGGGQDQTSPSSSPPPPHSSSTSSVNRKPGSLSDRRASSKCRVPTPLEPNGEHPIKPGKFSQPQRTPYPPPPPPPSSSSAFDADSDDGKRTSFLGKVFRGGGSGGVASKRQSRGSTPSSEPAPLGEQKFLSTSSLSSSSGGGGIKITPTPPPPVPESHPHWSQAPRSSAEGGGGVGGEAHSSVGAVARPLSAGSGLFQRARLSVGLRSRSEKRRNTLKGKIRAVET